MRFRRTKHDRVLVVGIFQSPKTGRAVLKNLHRTQFRRAAAIHASARGRPRVEENGLSAIGGSAATAAFGLALGAFIFWQRGMLADYRLGGLALFFVAFALAGALTGWILVRLLQEHVAAASLARCASTILPGETVVLAEVRATETSRLLAIMRDVEAEAPVTFAFHSPPHFRFKSSARPLGHELPSGQRLAENAARLAHEIPVSREAKARGPSFLHRLREIERALEWANASLTMSAEVHHAFTLSAEWLLDNAYLIREQVTDLRESLPQKQYGKLPLIASGPEAGLPRVYHVASEIVAESGGALEPEFIGKFLVAFQATALTNAINSCRRLAQIQWRELFQSTSRAESELAADPAGVYARLDFETSDRCRGAVEEVARWSRCSEQKTIDQALALAKAAEDEVARHVGYYLIDAGRPALERATSAKVPLAERSRRWLRAHAAGAYFGSIFLLTAAMVVAPLLFSAGSVHSLTHGLLGFLLLLPASELAALAVNYFVTSLLPPQVLPKMSFKKEGIPDDCRTLVVVPLLLTTPDAIQNELNRLEIRYLGNTDANLRFSLLTDFSDAPRESMPEDAEYIDIVARGIEELNRRHGAGRFFLFHRGRSWSDSEQRWIGWERKRGKLEQLNRFLIGESAPELEGFLRAGDRARLEGIRFVITLDADTQLLRDTARRLVETLAHPLNQARLSPNGRRVIRGYTIIQPSVSASLPSASATWFSRIFADQRGLDASTHAVSDA